jgi:hypothetical protein
MKKALCIAFMFFFLQQAFAGTDKQLWFGFNHQGRLAKHWGYWIDIQHRTRNNFAENLSFASAVLTSSKTIFGLRWAMHTLFNFLHLPIKALSVPNTGHGNCSLTIISVKTFGLRTLCAPSKGLCIKQKTKS